MQRIGDEIVLSPTDLTKHLGCAHITTLDLARLDGHGTPAAPDDALELVFRLGMAHEQAYLQSLKDAGLRVVEITTAYDLDGRRAAEAATLEAMRAGVDVVYQGTLFDGRWGGQADFLLRVAEPSDLGDWSYEIADTKLARKLKVAALLQLATYAERLAVLQGRAPRQLYVVTGDGQEHPWRLVDVAAYARRARARLRAAVEHPLPTEPVPVSQCEQCRWIARCAAEWRAADDLSLVAFLRADHRHALREAGITTVAGLAGCRPEDLPSGIGKPARERLVAQAALQVRERQTGEPCYELLAPEPGLGLVRLPEPDAGDLYLDFEGDPFADGGAGREYLAGLGDRDGGYTAYWAHSPAAERELTTALVDRLLAHWRAHPDMHVYHYAPYETTALKRLVARHGVREAELDQLLRGERFVDLYAVVRQGLRISKESYSIKKLEAFYWGAVRSDNPDVADALASVVAYEQWSEVPDETTLPAIEAYNRDDVRSTRDLHQWLEKRRAELEGVHGPQPRGAAGEELRPPSEAEQAEIDLAERLTDAGEDLLAGLVLYHRREARPAYWELFRLADLADDELVDDSAALGQLGEPVPVGKDKLSTLYRYEFPPQDTKFKESDKAYDVDTRGSAGTVFGIDAAAGWVVLKRKGEGARPRGLTEKQVVKDEVLRAAIAAVAADRLAGRACLGSALVDRRVPREITDVVETGLRLDGEVLAVQGPPGSGKTTVGAKLIRALLDAGKRVGVVANSHAVIGHLLVAVGRPAVQRCNEDDDFCGGPGVVQAANPEEVLAAFRPDGPRLAGGTAWLWARSELAGAVDVLIVDEAAQFSLANAVAVSRAARSMVLLGDPQQLAQPTRAEHPAGAGVSALGHLLAGHDTIPPECGIFLGTSWRMHPELAAFVSELSYEGRLQAGAGQERQAVAAAGMCGSGVRVVPVEHEANAAASEQEAVVVAELWRDLTAGRFTDRDGRIRAMTPDDVLVVAPYNAQVGLLRRALRDGARVGTVDKFQGQQAPVVLYSMTSSSAADAPRGVDFLYDVHRLNVAVSRAQALAVVVMSPALLDAAVTTPEQLRKVNALCRLAESVSAGGGRAAE